MDPIVIVGAARTPMGGFLGDLKDIAAPQLGARAIAAALSAPGWPARTSTRSSWAACCRPARARRPARQASLGAGVPISVGATTVNKMCGSGMKAAMLAHDLIAAGSADIVVAGGMESMSNAPYLLERARAGYRMGHGKVLDSMFLDGLEDAYDKGRLMGTFAEDCAEAYQFTRDAAGRLMRWPRWSAPTAPSATAPSPPKSCRDREDRQGARRSSRPTSSRRRRGPRRSRR